MKKLWIILLAVFAIIFGATIGLVIYTSNKNDERASIENKIEEISEKVTDECTEEYEQLEREAKLGLEANSSDEKISPNCLMTLKRYYSECGHTTNEYIDIPEELINKSQEELKEKYQDWDIQEFYPTQIVFYKEFEGSCGQHFVLRDNDGKLTVYKINENKQEVIYEVTDIDIDYLTETDKIEIKNGIRVNGIEDLNQLIENFE